MKDATDFLPLSSRRLPAKPFQILKGAVSNEGNVTVVGWEGVVSPIVALHRPPPV